MLFYLLEINTDFVVRPTSGASLVSDLTLSKVSDI